MEVTVFQTRTEQGADPEVRASKSSEFEERESHEHFKWTQLEQVQH